MDEIIKNLKELSGKHEQQLSEIREKLRLIDTIPRARALEGKCFKYKNGFSFGSKRPGWVYKRIIGISGENLIVDSFQMEGPNKVEFSFNDIEYVTRFNHPALIPITKKLYFKQFSILLKMLKKRGFYGK